MSTLIDSPVSRPVAPPQDGRRRRRVSGAIAWWIPIGVLAFLILYPLFHLLLTVGGEGTHIVRTLTSGSLPKILLNTLLYTLLTTVWGMALGLPLAWLLSRSDDRWTAAARTVICVGFVLPEFIYAISYVFVLDPQTGYLTRVIHLVAPSFNPPLYGLFGMVLLTGFFCIPQIVILVEPALRNVSADLEEAAEACGSRTLNTLLRVTFPLVMPSMLTAALLTALLAFASFGIPAALGIPSYFYVLSTDVYSLVSNYPPQFGQAAVLSMLFLVIGVLIATLQMYATRLSFRYRTLGGKGFKRRRQQPRLALRVLRGTYLWLMAAVVSIIPIGMIAAVSFAAKWWQLPGPVTLENYGFVLLKDPLLADMAITTGSVASLAIVGVVILALALGIYTTTRPGTPASICVRLLGYVALSVPPITFTVGALLAYVKPPLELYGTIWILVFSYWARFYPLAAAPIADALGQIDPALRESAAVAGAGGLRRLWSIELPLARSAVVAAALVVMMFTIRELLSAIFLQSTQVKMAMVSVFNYWDEGNFERAAAMASVIVFVSATIFILANRLQRGTAWRH
jgi:iron(III) transport system permease protein